MLVGKVLFWATLLGMVDEVQQYVWIASSYGEYLDFNDFVSNVLGAAAGVLIYYGFEPANQFKFERSFLLPEILLSAILCVGVAASCGGEELPEDRRGENENDIRHTGALSLLTQSTQKCRNIHRVPAGACSRTACSCPYASPR